jgi:ABC-2 type transport system permease protein
MEDFVMNQRVSFLGVLKYEFRMQLHRRAVWLSFIAFGLFFTQFHQPWFRPITTPASASIIYWTGIVQSFLAVAAGLLLADRLPRDRRMKVDELLNTLPCTVSTRMFGKYLGSTIATLVPMPVIYSIGIAYILVRWHTLQELPLALASFAAIVIPGVMFIGAFSIACTAILWVPLYQILFVGYWFWGNLLPNIGIPTLSTTILTPVGGYMCTGFFNPQGREGVCSPGIQGATALLGAESILLLLGTAILVIIALVRYIKWQQARQ